ncbi:MAG TPA: TAT-variant-translocated molybdopterin oxidoreductase [Candidatus Polarisedimenticolaceae bacterium]|nr:TAT-variant-translocated molybdopterin oxidoreductase [Candidatus Polarisedimenticolaceae bacterium]
MNGNYWRSLRDLAGDDAVREQQYREFPEGASELPEGITRREMMMMLGASLSLAGLAACRRPVEHIVPYVTAPEEIVPGIPRRYATTMPFGRSAYGLVVESHEGRPTKIEGNELHPASQGRSSVRMQAALLGLYDPDRLQTPRHGGEPATWTDFVTAWTGIDKALAADGGASLAVVLGSFASPTKARLLAHLREKYPRAHVAVYEAVSDENVLAGVESATGVPLQPALHVEKAAVLLTIGADVFGNDPEDVYQITGYAMGRRSGIDGNLMSRLWAVESEYTLTGGMADHRARLRASQYPAFLGALADKLSAKGVAGLPRAGATVEGIDAKWLDALAADLAGHRSHGLIVAGAEQPAAVHAAVMALNNALGNVGSTVLYHVPVDAALPSRASLASLASAMGAGQVKTLVVLGGNPAYDAPAELGFAEAMAKVETKIVLATHFDETARKATWAIPAAHFLESWDDARAIDGTASVVQPLILPLFAGKSVVEMLGLMTTGKEASAHDLVQESWKEILGAADFERKWNRVLHDGVLPNSFTAQVTPSVAYKTSQQSTVDSQQYEVHFRPSPYVHDGRFSNNGWLQELPDHVTKLTWDNPALLSPATARKLGVADEGLVKVTVRGKSVTLPVAIVPGQADGTVVLTLGYGRTGLGRIADGVGENVYPLRSAAAPAFDGGSIDRVDGTKLLSATQEHGSMEGRPIFREGTLEEFKKDPAFAQEKVEVPPLLSMWKEKAYDKGHQWGMTIDLNQCVGCNACVVACQSENNVPIVGREQVRRNREMHWIRVDRYFEGSEAAPRMVFQPIPCMQCENAPCEQVCPVAATVHDDEGLNVMVYNRCIGTRYCSNNCPYKVRRFNFFNYTKDTPEVLKLAQNPDVTVRSRGVMEKCTYCTQRINRAKLDARLAGRDLKDGDVVTACQQACPAGAIEFGDLLMPDTKIGKLKAEPRNYALLAELNSKPRTTYLARVRNPHPDLETA